VFGEREFECIYDLKSRLNNQDFEEMKPSGLLLFLFMLSFSISGQILNRSFELAEVIEPNAPPLCWEHENYAGIQNEFFPLTESGLVLNWNIEEPNDGDYFLVVHTGGFAGKNDRSVLEATAFQQIFLPAWTLIRGVYYFGTSDYYPYFDYGAIRLVPYNDPNDPNTPCDPNDPNTCPPVLQTIELARCSVNEVGNFGSTGAWIPFSYTILPQQEGAYKLIISVADVLDTLYESFFAVDNLSICGPLTPLGDVTRDCCVNMDDLAFFSHEWLQVCSIDPNYPNYFDPNQTDPNCMCADFTKDNIVDSNDLYPLHENWLINDL
jgi:hypothetical protein